MVHPKDYFTSNTSKGLTRKQKEAIKHLRSIDIKVERLKDSGEDVRFRDDFTKGKILDTNEISKWTDEVDYESLEKRLDNLSTKFDFQTSEEKDTLLNYLLLNTVISTRSLDLAKKPQKPNLAGLKWSLYFRDKVVMKRRKQGKKHKEIADELELCSGEADSWNITHRFRNRLNK